MKEIRESNYPRAKSMQLTLKWRSLVIVSVKKKLGSISRIHLLYIFIYLCIYIYVYVGMRRYICVSLYMPSGWYIHR